MAITDTAWTKIFMGFGIITVLSGIYLLIQGDYLIGASGSCVGALLIYQNMIKINDKDC